MKQLINDKDTFSLAQRLLGEEKVSAVINQEMPPKMRSLVTLPEDYTDLLNKVTTYECPNATASSSSKSKSVAMCLICGALVCFEVIIIKLKFDILTICYYSRLIVAKKSSVVFDPLEGVPFMPVDVVLI